MERKRESQLRDECQRLRDRIRILEQDKARLDWIEEHLAGRFYVIAARGHVSSLREAIDKVREVGATP